MDADDQLTLKLIRGEIDAMPAYENNLVVREEDAPDLSPSHRAMLGDPSITLWNTEGIKKADAGASFGLCVIGLLGIWNWRGANAACCSWTFVASPPGARAVRRKPWCRHSMPTMRPRNRRYAVMRRSS